MEFSMNLEKKKANEQERCYLWELKEETDNRGDVEALWLYVRTCVYQTVSHTSWWKLLMKMRLQIEDLRQNQEMGNSWM